MPVHVLIRVAAALGARVDVRVLWQGEGLDRLLDARHAAMVEHVVALLSASDWQVSTEVSFNLAGERGSIDILGFHPASGSLLVVEIKSVVPDMQAMLMSLDRKSRLARSVVADRGWSIRSVSRLLVFPDDRTSRRRVAAHAATFASVLPAGTAAARRWLRAPAADLHGILFLSDPRRSLPNDRQVSTRHRVATRHTARGARPSVGERPTTRDP